MDVAYQCKTHRWLLPLHCLSTRCAEPTYTARRMPALCSEEEGGEGGRKGRGFASAANESTTVGRAALWSSVLSTPWQQRRGQTQQRGKRKTAARNTEENFSQLSNRRRPAGSVPQQETQKRTSHNSQTGGDQRGQYPSKKHRRELLTTLKQEETSGVSTPARNTEENFSQLSNRRRPAGSVPQQETQKSTTIAARHQGMHCAYLGTVCSWLTIVG